MPRIQLTPEERAELAQRCKDPQSFHSDGREVLWACIVVPLLCLPLLAVLYGDARKEWDQLQAGELTIGTSLLFMAPEALGFVALSIAALCIALYGIQTYGRHGVVLTSFGVARLRGSVRRLIRYPDIVELNVGKRRRPKHHIITDELEIKSRDGQVIMLYGFAAGLWKSRIEEAMQHR